MFPTRLHVVRTAAAITTFVATFTSLAANPSISPKEQMHLDMIALAQQMHTLRAEMAASEDAAAIYEQLAAAYQQMSDKLGGDDPGRAIVSSGPTASGENAAPALGAHPPLDDGGIAGTFATPPGCQASQLSLFGNSTDFPISDGGTTLSPITVSGLTGRVWFVEPRLHILHTFNADLDITLRSPSGRVITLSTDNGGGNDNVFFGTTFVDDGDPDGQVPYSTNDGLVTDHLYQNDVTATPLVPEEPLHAFAGEDPNGVWTLSIVDDANGNTGVLLDWDMFVLTASDPTTRTTRTFTNNAPGTVDAGLLVRNIDVAGMGGFLCDVQVRLDVTSDFDADLDISLTSPSGRVITLTTDNGADGNDGFAGTTFDDAVDGGFFGVHTATDGLYVDGVPMNVLTPEESFGSLRGTSANGTWSLRISDDLGVFPAHFLSASLILTTCSCEDSCPGDINGDGATNIDDLLGIIGGWGLCP